MNAQPDQRSTVADIWDEAFTAYFDREGWTVAASNRVMVGRWEAPRMPPTWSTSVLPTPATEREPVQSIAPTPSWWLELEKLTLPELIRRYARTWHRCANQPHNSELAAQLADIWRELERKLLEWNRP